MINLENYYNKLKKIGAEFITGVPDTLLNDFCLGLDKFWPSQSHVIAANEGNAIALASGILSGKWHRSNGLHAKLWNGELYKSTYFSN